MTNSYIHLTFSPDTLKDFQGYNLQAFASGRLKLSFHTTTPKRVEYSADAPKRDREGSARQKTRSVTLCADHFTAIDHLLAEHDDARVFRLHSLGDNNATADNAHVLVSYRTSTIFMVLNGLVHEWQVGAEVIEPLLRGKGRRQGTSSIFNEYAPSYDHDWQPISFREEDYRKGFRQHQPRITKPTPGSSFEDEFTL